MAARSLTVGNAAKLYCLQLIEQRVRDSGGTLRILDAGCGDARNFVELLGRYPDVEYYGFDPSADAVAAARRNLAGTRAVVTVGSGEHASERGADVAVSFSVLEHVRAHREYLALLAESVAAGGVVFVNFDYGHFGTEMTASDRVKTLLRQQAPVDVGEFRRLASAAGFGVSDEKAFNTDLKLTFRRVPPEHQDEFMAVWLAFELALNADGFADVDGLWRTRNFVLERR